jgi:hypothetical protein
LFWAASTAAGVALILLLFEPTRNLRPVLVLLAVAVAPSSAVLPQNFRRSLCHRSKTTESPWFHASTKSRSHTLANVG